MGDVVILGMETRLAIPSERVLNGALKADLERCLVVGVDEDDVLWFGASVAKWGDVLVLLERAHRFAVRQITMNDE